jgi:thiol:disulfide interchange protein
MAAVEGRTTAMILHRRNIPYIAAFVVLFAFFGWILSKMAAQTHGRTLAYMVAAMAVSLVVLGVSARLFMARSAARNAARRPSARRAPASTAAPT